MSLADVTAQSVRAAIAEFDRLGRDAFLRSTGFGHAQDYYLEHEGRLYDSKAIVGYAHGASTGTRLGPADFSWGDQTILKRLRGLGFTVHKARAPSAGSDRPMDLGVISASSEGKHAQRREQVRKRVERVLGEALQEAGHNYALADGRLVVIYYSKVRDNGDTWFGVPNSIKDDDILVLLLGDQSNPIHLVFPRAASLLRYKSYFRPVGHDRFVPPIRITKDSLMLWRPSKGPAVPLNDRIDAYPDLIRVPSKAQAGIAPIDGSLMEEDQNAAPRLPVDGFNRITRLDWIREELILAMDFYVLCGAINGSPIPGQGSAEIARLSALLKALNAYPPERQGIRYRNPQGVYLKLMSLRAIQTHGEHSMNAYSQLDAAVWRDYIDDMERLRTEAEAIRQRLGEGVLVPAKETAPVVEDVPIEQQHTERFMVSPSGESREAERAEQSLVLLYRDYMASKGITVIRRRYLPIGQVRPIYCDAWVEERNALIEAKNSDSREALRQAIGQLYDYRRFHQPPVLLALLLPYRPNRDGLALLRSAGIEAIWRHGPRFHDSANGRFV
jgi:hypothetical protein